MNTDAASKKVHQGRNIKRLREMLGIKQEALAFDLGVNQSAVSDYEKKEVLEDHLLKKISEILKVPVEAIKNMNDEATYNYINTFNDKVDNSIFNSEINQPTFNPIDKVVELYERMIKDRDELIKKLSEK